MRNPAWDNYKYFAMLPLLCRTHFHRLVDIPDTRRTHDATVSKPFITLASDSIEIPISSFQAGTGHLQNSGDSPNQRQLISLHAWVTNLQPSNNSAKAWFDCVPSALRVEVECASVMFKHPQNSRSYTTAHALPLRGQSTANTPCPCSGFLYWDLLRLGNHSCSHPQSGYWVNSSHVPSMLSADLLSKNTHARKAHSYTRRLESERE